MDESLTERVRVMDEGLWSAKIFAKNCQKTFILHFIIVIKSPKLKFCPLNYLYNYSKMIHVYSSVVEHMFPKPDVAGSSPARRGFLPMLNFLRFVTQLGRVVALQVTFTSNFI